MSVKIPVTIELKDEAQLARVVEMVEGDMPPANKVDAFVNELLGQVIDGAMILPADAVDRILEINPELEDSDALVDAVEAGSGMSNGEMVIRWPVDPALTQPLKDRADTNGVSVQQLIRELMDQCTALGYFYDLAANLRVVFFDREDERKLAEFLGNDSFTSTDIMDAIRKLQVLGPTPDNDDEDDDNDDGIFEPATVSEGQVQA